MSGLGPILYAPWGASASWRMAITRDGAALDLTGASAIAFTLRDSPTLPDSSAALTLNLTAGLTVVDALAGLVSVTLTAAQSAALRSYGNYYYKVAATLAGGSVAIPDLLRGEFTTDLASLESQVCDGGNILRLDASSGTLTPTTPDMANYIINRYDLTGLTGGTSVKLDGLPTATLAFLANGAVVRVYFSGGIMADFRLRANTGAETESAPWNILADNATLRLWELLGVWKEGAPCLWVSSLSKFKQVLENSGSIALADDADAFVLP
jgi:hypothetical protein